MVRVHTLNIDPPVANASCAWASDYIQLRELYETLYTGAVTTRTATLNGFPESEMHTVRKSLLFIIHNSHEVLSGCFHVDIGVYAQFLWLLSSSSPLLYWLGENTAYNANLDWKVPFEAGYYQYNIFEA